MGGYGSGRAWWRRTRLETDHALALDVRWLARRGYLPQEGQLRTGSLEWSSRGKVTASIGVRSDGRDPDGLTLFYRTRRQGEEWVDVEDRLSLTSTDCNYGGSRVWFVCPGCGSRRAVLYNVSGRFRCRVCQDLAYSSTRETRTDRMMRRASGVQKKLKLEHKQSVWDWGPKPKGMHWKTYDRLRRELIACERTALFDLTIQRDKLFARIDRKYGHLFD